MGILVLLLAMREFTSVTAWSAIIIAVYVSLPWKNGYKNTKDIPGAIREVLLPKFKERIDYEKI